MLTLLIAPCALSLSDAVRGMVHTTLVILMGAMLTIRPPRHDAACRPKAVAQEPCCPTHGSDPAGAAFQARLEGLLSEAGRGASEELLDVVRAALRSRQQLPSRCLGELLLQGYLAHDLRDEFDELYAEMCPGGVVPTIKMLALRRMW